MEFTEGTDSPPNKLLKLIHVGESINDDVALNIEDKPNTQHENFLLEVIFHISKYEIVYFDR